MIDRNRFTEQAWNAIALSTRTANELGHNYVGTEHLLVGLLLEEEGVAARVLDANGVTADKVKELISQLPAGVLIPHRWVLSGNTTRHNRNHCPVPGSCGWI